MRFSNSSRRRLEAGFVLAAVLFAGAVAAEQRGPLELATAPVPPGARRIAYGSGPLQFGELRVPSTPGPHPVAIVVHGGCWLAKLGNLDARAVALDNMRPLAAALTEAGVATWNIEYRRLGDEGGGWPGTFLDVGRGADFLRTLARDERLDLGRVVSIGHSAGAHLAMWLAARSKLPATSDLYAPDPVRLTGVVSLDGPADLKATLPLERPVCGAPVVTNLIGGSPEALPERYRDASPIERLPLGVPQAFFRPDVRSPLRTVRRGRPPRRRCRSGDGKARSRPLPVHRSAVRDLAGRAQKRAPAPLDAGVSGYRPLVPMPSRIQMSASGLR